MTTFAVGTDFVPHDMVAQIHKGEAIIPASQNNRNSQGTNSTHAIAITINNNGSTDSGVTSSAGAERLGTAINAAVKQTLIREQRPGGLLNSRT
jgi:hypothetical protein